MAMEFQVIPLIDAAKAKRYLSKKNDRTWVPVFAGTTVGRF